MSGHYRAQGTVGRSHLIPAAVMISLLAWGACPARGVTLEFDFAESDQGWVPGFADYPAGEEEQYGLTAEHRQLPSEVGSGLSWYLSGSNFSDDLWMYLKREVTGLAPSMPYSVTFSVQLASAYPEGSVGIGGSPGDSVWLKAGASPEEPQTTVDSEGLHRMTVDKGEQSGGGANAVVLGTIAKPDDGTEDYVTIERQSPMPVFVTSNAQGSLWLILGTDSGFEGTTSLYYQHVQVTLEAIPEPSGVLLLAVGGLTLSGPLRRAVRRAGR